MAFEPGSVIADYEVLRSLGEGAVAEVYLVKHRVTGRLEAMKVLHRRGLADQRVDRFLREIKLQAGLSHPNIAAVRTALEVDGELLMIMEYVEGQSLRAIIEQGRPKAATALDYILQALSALEYAHGHEITHRDVTPSNMLVSAEGKLKLTDFGLAKAMGNPSLTQTGTPLGSLFYMSPEHVRGVAAADHRSDIYSVGAVLYELVTGSPPFEGSNAFEVMRAQVEEQPKSPADAAPGLIPGVEEVLMRALAKDPEKRFAAATEMRQALVGLKDNVQHGWTTTPADAPEAPTDTDDKSKSLSQLLPAYLREQMKQPYWWAPAFGAALALLLLVAWVWTRPVESDIGETTVSAVASEAANSETLQASRPGAEMIDPDAGADSSTVSEEAPPIEPTADNPQPSMSQAPALRKTEYRAAVASDNSRPPAPASSIEVSGTRAQAPAVQPAKPTPLAADDASSSPMANGDSQNGVARKTDNSAQPRLLETLRIPRLNALAASRDGSLVAGASNDNAVRIWNPRRPQGETLLEGHLAPVTAITFGPAGRFLASGDRSGAIKFWDLQSEREIAALSQKGAVQFVAFSREGDWMASGSSDESIGLWKRAGASNSPRWQRAMKGHRQPPLAIAFSPDGTQVVTSSDEKLVHVWPVHSEAKPQRIDIREGGARSITFSEDGRWLAAASDRSLTIWDASHLERARQVDIPEGRHIVAFTPAGLCVVASATFRTLRLWEATTGQELAVLDTDVRVEEMTMTPAGDRLMVADTNGNLRIWEVRVPDAASLRARSTLPADFAEAPAQPEPAADSESEGNRLGIFHHVVDLFR